MGYSKHAPSVLVGGPNSVDLPSAHRGRRGRGRGGRYHSNRGRDNYQNHSNKTSQHNNIAVVPSPSVKDTNTGTNNGTPSNSVGRGLLETPVVSPWHQGFGYEEIQNSNFKRYMKGMQKAEQARSNISKLQHQRQVYSSRTRHQHNQQQQQQQKYNNNSQSNISNPSQHQSQQQSHNPSFYSQQQQHKSSHYSGFSNSNSFHGFNKHNQLSAFDNNDNNKNTWVGKGRGMQSMTSSSYSTPIGRGVTPSTRGGYRSQHQQLSLGRGQWVPSSPNDIE